MIIPVTLRAEISLLSDTIKFGQLWRQFATILAVWGFGDKFLVGVNGKVYKIHGEDLVVFVYDILVFVKLNIFLFIV